MSDPAYQFPDDADCDEYEEPREEDEFVLDCGDPRCLMPGYHSRHECYTAEDAEALFAEMGESY